MEINFEELKKVTANIKKYPNASLLLDTKNRPQNFVKLLLDSGYFLFGENRVQEAKTKWKPLKSKYDGL